MSMQESPSSRRRVPFTGMNLEQRRRLAISVLVFIVVTLVILGIFGFCVMLGNYVDWILVFVWGVPVAASIGVAVHLVNYLDDTKPLGPDEE